MKTKRFFLWSFIVLCGVGAIMSLMFNARASVALLFGAGFLVGLIIRHLYIEHLCDEEERLRSYAKVKMVWEALNNLSPEVDYDARLPYREAFYREVDRHHTRWPNDREGQMPMFLSHLAQANLD